MTDDSAWQPRAALDRPRLAELWTRSDAELRDVAEVTVTEARDVTLQLLFDPEHNLEERILSEQFAY